MLDASRKKFIVKCITAGDKRTSFVGSHFFYEDVSGRSIEEDTHELVAVAGEFTGERLSCFDPMAGGIVSAETMGQPLDAVSPARTLDCGTASDLQRRLSTP